MNQINQFQRYRKLSYNNQEYQRKENYNRYLSDLALYVQKTGKDFEKIFRFFGNGKFMQKFQFFRLMQEINPIISQEDAFNVLQIIQQNLTDQQEDAWWHLFNIQNNQNFGMTNYLYIETFVKWYTEFVRKFLKFSAQLMVDTITKQKMTVDEFFHKIDYSQDKVIDYQEFKEVIQKYVKEDMNDSQVQILFNFFDYNNDQHIDLREFQDKIQRANMELNNEFEQFYQGTSEIIKELIYNLNRQYSSFQEFEKQFVNYGKVEMDLKDFGKFLRQNLTYAISSYETQLIFRQFDSDGSGSISAQEIKENLLKCWNYLNKKEKKIEQVMKQIASQIKKKNIDVNKIFNCYASNQNKEILSFLDFKKLLNDINPDLSPEEANNIIEYFDYDHNNFIDKNEFKNGIYRQLTIMGDTGMGQERPEKAIQFIIKELKTLNIQQQDIALYKLISKFSNRAVLDQNGQSKIAFQTEFNTFPDLYLEKLQFGLLFRDIDGSISQEEIDNLFYYFEPIYIQIPQNMIVEQVVTFTQFRAFLEKYYRERFYFLQHSDIILDNMVKVIKKYQRGGDLKQIFNKYADSGQEGISQNGFINLISDLQCHIQNMPFVSEKEILILFNQFDQDFSGQISYNEFNSKIEQVYKDRVSKQIECDKFITKMAIRLIKEFRSQQYLTIKSIVYNLFSKFDIDQNQILDKNEFIELLRSIIGQQPQEIYEEIFKRFDAFKSEKISAEYFWFVLEQQYQEIIRPSQDIRELIVKFVNLLYKNTDLDIEKVFKQIDQNGDNAIDFYEIGQLFNTILGETVPSSVINQIFDIFDQNNDRNINFDEFYQGLQFFCEENDLDYQIKVIKQENNKRQVLLQKKTSDDISNSKLEKNEVNKNEDNKYNNDNNNNYSEELKNVDRNIDQHDGDDLDNIDLGENKGSKREKFGLTIEEMEAQKLRQIPKKKSSSSQQQDFSSFEKLGKKVKK